MDETVNIEFTAEAPIYRQVSDYCCAAILDGRWAPDGRIPSTKDLALQLAVNHRTVMRAYEELAAADIIYQRRGMGYFVAADADRRILEQRRRQFLDVTVPRMAATMRRLGLTPADILPLLQSL